MKKLPKVGDKVKLNQFTPIYGYFLADYPYNKGYIKRDTIGECNVTNVPAPLINRLFACIDFPPDTPLFTRHGEPIPYKNPHNNSYRVAVYPEECELIK